MAQPDAKGKKATMESHNFEGKGFRSWQENNGEFFAQYDTLGLSLTVTGKTRKEAIKQLKSALAWGV